MSPEISHAITAGSNSIFALGAAILMVRALLRSKQESERLTEHGTRFIHGTILVSFAVCANFGFWTISILHRYGDTVTFTYGDLRPWVSMVTALAFVWGCLLMMAAIRRRALSWREFCGWGLAWVVGLGSVGALA